MKSLPELIAYGKAEPGKLSYGVDATSGYGVVVGRLMNKRGGIGMVEVPYRATGQMLQETAAGTTQAMISSFAAVVGFARDGKVRRIAISSRNAFRASTTCRRSARRCRASRSTAGWWWWRRPARRPTSSRGSTGRSTIPAQARCPAAAQHFGLAIGGANTPATTEDFIRREQAQWRAIAQELNLQPE